jgi:hypothetical protein
LGQNFEKKWQSQFSTFRIATFVAQENEHEWTATQAQMHPVMTLSHHRPATSRAL